MLYTQNYCYMMIMSQVNAIARNFSSKIISAFTRCYCIKKLPARAGYVRHMGSIPQSGRSPGEGHGNPTPVFFPGESHEQRSLADYSLWGCKESDMTK